MLQLKAQDYRQVPWRNGRGRTSEIMVEPAGAGPDDFLWRVSMAEVAEDGAFSAFPGIDRVLTVIAGGGLTLEIAGRVATPGNAPFAFPGDVPCFARLASGPITDLNVMTRRGRCRAVVRRGAGDPLPGATARLIFALGRTEARVDGERVVLAPRDTLRLPAAAAAPELAGTWLDIQILPSGDPA